MKSKYIKFLENLSLTRVINIRIRGGGVRITVLATHDLPTEVYDSDSFEGAVKRLYYER